MGKSEKPSHEEILEKLKDGNLRFVAGTSTRPHANMARLVQAGKKDQGKHAYATVITCSDSRVPVELIFDAGIMDIVVIRVAGNVCRTDEVGSIEYGLCHVHTPVLVILGHTQCGAVTIVVQAIQGKVSVLERNIPPLVAPIIPAVERAIEKHTKVDDDEIILSAIEENVWQSIEDLLTKSPVTRQLVNNGNVKVVGAVYNVGNGEINWLENSKVNEIMERVETIPDIEMNIYSSLNI